MKRFYFFLLIFCFLISNQTHLFSQSVPRFYSNEQEQSNKKFKNNPLDILLGDEQGFVIVTGGLGPKGPASFYLNDPSSLQNIGSNLSGKYFLGGDYSPDGKWYVTEWMGHLYEVNPENGGFTLLGSVSETLTGLAYSVADGKYYACTGGELFELNIATLELASIGPMVNSGSMTGLAADIRGNLYGIDINDDKLYKIDPYTGMSVAVGSLGYDFDYLQNLTYDRDNDVLYHAGFIVSPDFHGALYKVDLETGEAIEVGPFPNTDEVTAFAIPWTFPEHGSISGVVYDYGTGMPIQNSIITLTPLWSGGTHAIRHTDENGCYIFEVVLPGDYELTVEFGGYTPVSIFIQVLEGQTIICDVVLLLAPYQCTFTVQEFESGTPIENSEITFMGLVQITNEYGVAVFENVPSGTFDYTVNAEGYYEGFGEVTIIDQNVEVTVDLYVLANVQKELVILEKATGTWCVGCPAAANGLDDLVENGHPVGVIAYHSGDDFENPDGAVRLGYYGVIGYPTVVFDGLEQYMGGGSAGQTMYETYLPYVEEAYSKLTPVEINYQNVNYNEVERKITGEIKVGINGPVNSDQVRLRMALTESQIPYSWGGLDELNFVERGMFPDNYGIALECFLPDTVINDFEFTLENDWNVENCEIVIFVQNDIGKEIFNGIKFGYDVFTGLPACNVKNRIKIFPNPASGFINVTGRNILKIEILSLQGFIINSVHPKSDNTTICVNDLPAGIYFIRIFTSEKIINKKIVVR